MVETPEQLHQVSGTQTSPSYFQHPMTSSTKAGEEPPNIVSPLTNAHSRSPPQDGTKAALPSHLCCPICLEVMVEPVTTVCGHTYDKSCLEDFFASCSAPPSCPICRTSIQLPIPKVSVLLRDMIGEKLPKESRVRTAQLGIQRKQRRMHRIMHDLEVSTINREEVSQLLAEILATISEADTPDVQACAVHALSQMLSTSERLISDVIHAGTLRILLKLVTTGGLEVQEACMHALSSIACGTNEHRDAMLEAGVAEALIKTFTARQQPGVGASAGSDNYGEGFSRINLCTRVVSTLSNLAQGSNACRVRIVRAGAVKPLVALLGHASMSVLEGAASALGNIACGDDVCREEIINQGALQPLVALLHSGTNEARGAAASAIGNMSCGSDARRRKVVESGAVKSLVELLASGSEISCDARARVAGAMLNMAAGSDEFRAELIGAGALRVLVHLLIQPATSSHAQAANVLLNIACGNNKYRQAVIDAGAVPVLVSQLITGSSDAKNTSAGALWCLAAGTDLHRDKVVQAGALPPLIALLSSDSIEAQISAAGALWNIAAGSDEVRKQILRAGGLPALIRVVQTSGSTSAKARAADAIRNIACGDLACRYAVVEAGALPALVGVLRSHVRSPERYHEAVLGVTMVDALCCIMAGNSFLTNLVQEAGAVEPVLQLLGARTSDECGLACSDAVCCFASGQSTEREVLVRAGAVPILTKLLEEDPLSEIRHRSADALSSIAIDPRGCTSQLLQANALKPMLAMLTSQETVLDCKLRLAETLANLAKASLRFKNMMVQLSVPSRLLEAAKNETNLRLKAAFRTVVAALPYSEEGKSGPAAAVPVNVRFCNYLDSLQLEDRQLDPPPSPNGKQITRDTRS
ncbi:hypothetical protein CYMTET_13283 [Cymbomonas tetramitiformis]|uniref:RING-type E3 ubiquitin transferase n=1 Tax=Cymbomonas tetramitiformis TaxID=36881 RepID=A0AAE0GIT0_9CHLO|nr:hypothetical protein CYMTET_13283 [Cymbomonas tetramitiformis]